MTGSGTLADPYIIYDVNDLQNVNLDVTAYYELANDIDASATSDWNTGAGFIPIGQAYPYFTGHFDGKGYKVTSLFINRPTEDYIGLFGSIDDPGVVQNLGVEDCNITGDDYVGGLVGYNYKTITNCYTTGAVTGDTTVGGLVGDNWDTGVITDSYSTCTVTCDSHSGGFAGENDGIIRRCYAIGNVTCTGAGVIRAASGFVHSNTAAAEISDCYARGDATSTDRASGFVDGGGGTIQRCYSTGKPTGTEASGFCYIGGPFTACFWDTETSGKDTAGDYPPYGDVVGKTTAQMKAKSTFTDADWDFDTVWGIYGHCNGGYPCLRDVTPSCEVKIKGNPNIDQRMFQHVERMER